MDYFSEGLGRNDEAAQSSLRADRDSEPGAKADWAGLTKNLPGRPEEEALDELAVEFIGRLIQEYERAVESGLPPSRAMACLIGWASGECERIRP
jgi:hypothetical protein